MADVKSPLTAKEIDDHIKAQTLPVDVGFELTLGDFSKGAKSCHSGKVSVIRKDGYVEFHGNPRMFKAEQIREKA